MSVVYFPASGASDLDLGLERAGMETIWFVENNPFCQQVLAKHWPGVPCYGDIQEIDFSALPTVDLLCGGFPCQPVSCAGKRQGDKDERWLWPEFYRAVCEARPRYVLVENVPGLLSVSNGRLFGGILRDLAEVGYDAEWDVLSAAQFGALHLRFRVFLVAYAKQSGLEIFQCQPGHNVKKLAAIERNSYRREWWTVESDVGRVAHGVPFRVDRLKCLGNAVVPQCVEWIGRRIMELSYETE